MLVRPYESNGFFEPPVTIDVTLDADDDLSANLNDLSVTEVKPRCER